MTIRNIKLKENDYVHKCPKCGNNTEFTIKSNYCSEDCCEIWVCCKCGYDPTSDNTKNRLEDVWGGCDDDNCKDAITNVWNELIKG